MSSPQSVEEFLALLLKSGLVDNKRLKDYLLELSADTRPRTPRAMAELLRREGLLSNYGALQLLRGKWDQFRIGPYKIVERLGMGEMSNVYLCERPVTRAHVAVKVLIALKAADPTAVQRFYREARAAASLVHPNIVRAYDVDQDAQGHFMVMDYIDGSNIQDIVERFGPMDPIRCAHYIRQAAIGLQYAHEKGLVHRDVKPANLLIDREGTVKILDMGLARFSQDAGGVLTRGVVLGAPEYLAPEQGIDSHNVDTRADVYGLGATCYFMLTGQPPYAEEKTIAGKLTSKQSRDPAPILMLRGEVPEELAEVVQKFMARDPAKRFPNPGAAAEALSPWTQTPIPPPSESEMPDLVGPDAAKDRPAESPGLRPPEPSVPKPPDRSTKPLPIRKTVEAPARLSGERPALRSPMPAPLPRRTAVSTPPDSIASPPKAPTAETTEPDPAAVPHRRRKRRSRLRRRRSRMLILAVVLLLVGFAVVLVGWFGLAGRN